MSRYAATALIALSALLLAQPVSAQWKWREGDRIVFSDRPPPARIPERAILERPPGLQRGAVPPSPTGPSLVQPPPPPAASAPATEPALEAKMRREAEEKAAQQAAQQKAEEARLAAMRADNCLRARNQLKMLDDGVRVARTNDKGEREILDDRQRAEEQQRTRSIIASDCAAN